MLLFLQQKRRAAESGFTLIELLVVIAMVGMLSSVVLASLNTARAKARDVRRKADLVQIRTALQLYYDNSNSFVGTGSGCGYAGNGNGWFNYVGGSYPKSIASCLVDAGVVPAEVIDPTGGQVSTPTNGYSYMKYNCGSDQTYVYAKLEREPQSSAATDNTCCSYCDSSYGMNYYLKI